MAGRPEIRGLTVAVGDWYAKTLSICLPKNMRHLSECLVITSPGDHAVKEVVASVPGARVFETTGFTEFGAHFNKGLSVERGFMELGRHGNLLVHDADIMFPDVMPLDRYKPGQIHGCSRRVLDDPAQWTEDLDWSALPSMRYLCPHGFFQLFHADDPYIARQRPWYDPTFSHAGGSDDAFLKLWPDKRHVRLPFDVLHLGPAGVNWFGTGADSRRLMRRLSAPWGWNAPESTDADRPILERVSVPASDPVFLRPTEEPRPMPRGAHIIQSVEISRREDLAELANSRGYRTAVEVGVDRGIFARSFLDKFRGKFFAVDDWARHPEQDRDRAADLDAAVAALAPDALRTMLVRMPSVEAAGWLSRVVAPDIVYLDGQHDEESVAADLRAWWHILSPTGMLCGHDHDPTHPGVLAAVRKFADERDLVVRLTHEDVTPSFYIYRVEPHMLKRGLFRDVRTGRYDFRLEPQRPR